MSRNKVVLTALLSLSIIVVSCPLAESAPHKSKRRSYSGLVPPPPPMAVSPTVLAAYPSGMGQSHKLFYFSPEKPKPTSQSMKLTCVMDDTAFFKVKDEESISLKAGMTYQNVLLAQISPDSVVLQEKGKQIVMRLR